MPISRGQIYYIDFGPKQHGNRAIEGKHFAVVLQNEKLNRLPDYGLVVLVPITSKKRPSPSYVEIEPTKANGLSVVSFAKCEQVFTVDQAFLSGEPVGQVTVDQCRQIAGRAAHFALGISPEVLGAAGLL